MFSDTHCHVIPLEYDNYKEILKSLKDNNISRIIVNGYDLESNKEVVNICSNYENVYGALGVHPDNTENYNESIKYIKENLNNPKIIAIGEIGLDYFHNKENKEDQLKLFETLLKLAENVNKAVIIHTRDATEDTLITINKYKLKGVIHCFSGSLETAKEYIKKGYKLGIGGVITFNNSNLPNTLKEININNILLETDSPYLSPVPLRGSKNEPKNINIIAKKISEIYDIEPNKLSIILEQNFNDIFDIKY